MDTHTARSNHQRLFLTRTQRFVAAVGAAILVILGAISAATPAHADTAGVLSGTVTDDVSGAPLEDVWIYLYSFSTGSLDNSTPVATDATGHYRVDSVSADGDYAVYVSAAHRPGNYTSEYLSRRLIMDDATHIALSNSTETTQNITLVEGGSITGNVTYDDEFHETAVQVMAFIPHLSDWKTIRFSTVNADGTYAADNLAPGQYIIRFYDPTSDDAFLPEYYTNKYDPDDADLITVTGGASTSGIDIELSASPGIPVTRLAGTNRFQTSAQIAAEYTSASVVFVANGLGYPDALSAAPAAALMDGPLLLTARDYLPAEVKAQIERLSPEYIWVIGGTGVVSEAVFDELTPLGTDVFRVEGSNRYETSLEVVKTFWPGAGITNAFLADGRNFPDALSAASGAAKVSGPVALVNGGLGSVPSPLGDYLELGVNQVTIAGGSAVLSGGIEASAAANSGVGIVVRKWGSNRYETSVAINGSFFTPPIDTAYFAVGTGYADALAGAALAGKSGYPLYLVPGNCVPNDVISEILRLGITKVVLLGGTGVLSPAVEALTPCSP
jgi:putative cell wall-binding protein